VAAPEQNAARMPISLAEGRRPVPIVVISRSQAAC
jgi:hypothetical protein